MQIYLANLRLEGTGRQRLADEVLCTNSRGWSPGLQVSLRTGPSVVIRTPLGRVEGSHARLTVTISRTMERDDVEEK